MESLDGQALPVQQWTIRLQQEIGTSAESGKAVCFWCNILQPAVIQAYRNYKKASDTLVMPSAAINISGLNPDNLVARGFISLEDAEWDKADCFFEQALMLDAKNAKAYFGKAFLSVKISSQDELAASCLIEIQDNKEFKRAKRFADPAFASKLDGITAEIARRMK